MNNYLLDPNVCPSSLNENDEPTTQGETSHKYSGGECSECGATAPEPQLYIGYYDKGGEMSSEVFVTVYKTNEDIKADFVKYIEYACIHEITPDDIQGVYAMDNTTDAEGNTYQITIKQ